jgi:hypothetical protein
MIIPFGVLMLGIGILLIARTIRRPGKHRAEPEWKRLRPAHARPRFAPRPANLDRAGPHRLVAQDAALSRR